GLVAAAAVAPASPLTPVTGFVTVREGGRALARSVPVRGRVSARLPALARGRHVLRATYDGSGVYAPSTSAPVVVTVR
ncbi:MAG: Ig-like domain-containing protein, partial [Actinomycetota bacterium]